MNALNILKKENLRIIDISKYKTKTSDPIKYFNRSFLMQSRNDIILDKKKLKCVTKLRPSKKK